MSYVSKISAPVNRARITTSNFSIGRGDVAIKNTLKIMRQIIRQESKKPLWRSLAVQITRPVADKDLRGEAEKIFQYVKERVKFVRDINGAETVQYPYVTLFELGAGDCDDFTVLLGTLLAAIGHKTRLKVIATDKPRRRKAPFSHVYLQDLIGGQWITLDASDKKYNFGYEYPFRSRVGLMEV